MSIVYRHEGIRFAVNENARFDMKLFIELFNLNVNMTKVEQSDDILKFLYAQENVKHENIYLTTLLKYYFPYLEVTDVNINNFKEFARGGEGILFDCGDFILKKFSRRFSLLYNHIFNEAKIAPFIGNEVVMTEDTIFIKMKKIEEKKSVIEAMESDIYIENVLRKLCLLHSKSILHGDLHVGNTIVTSDDMDVELIDFGRSRFVDHGLDRDIKYFIWHCLVIMNVKNYRYEQLWIKYCPGVDYTSFKEMDDFIKFIGYYN
jgi:serine/threonine protein kinase